MQENNSQNANLILARLKKLMKISTDIELSELLNVKPNTISTWKKRNSLDYTSIISICELYEINLNDIFFEKKLPNQDNVSYDSETPLVSRETQFQYCIGNPTLLEGLPKFSFPFVKGENTRAFQVIGNNMYPTIEENSFVLCENSDLKSIEDNNLIVIISRTKGFFINRIHRKKEKENFFLLKSENPIFADIEINSSDVNEIWVVKGVLSYAINCPSKTQINTEVHKKVKPFASDKKNKI